MLDVAMTPSCIKGTEGVTLLRQLVEVYGEMGGMGLQFNVVDTETLQAALSDPDSGLTFEILMDTFLEAVENSVFIRGMEKQQEKETKAAQLKKQGAV